MVISYRALGRALVLAVACGACREAEIIPEAFVREPVGGTRDASDTVRTVASLTLDAPRLVLRVGDTLTVRAMARDRLDNVLPGRAIAWTSSDTAIVRVSAGGQLTARGSGPAHLVAKSGRAATRWMVLVQPAAAPVVTLHPGDDLAAAVRGAPPGTTFRLTRGTYLGQSVAPKDGMSFIGEPGVVLDGQERTTFAFRADSGAFVTLRHLTIVGYKPPLQDGAINATGADGWVVDSCEIARNHAGGIRLGNRMRVSNSHIHHNGQIGILGSGDAIVIEDNEIDNNNPADLHDMYWEAGGTKFARTRDLVVRRNFVHHNHGPGLWTDIDNVRVLMEENRVEDNYEAGILHEISYRAVIRNNVARRNGTHAVPAGDITGAGILVSVSADVEVTGNTVEDNKNGIVGIQDQRGAGAYGTYQLQGLHVHDNLVRMPHGATGIVTRGWRKLTDAATYRSLGNRFTGNRYSLPADATAFVWRNGRHTLAEWRELGQDAAPSAALR